MSGRLVTVPRLGRFTMTLPSRETDAGLTASRGETPWDFVMAFFPPPTDNRVLPFLPSRPWFGV
ncbi:hypothetical protein BJY20_002660 [Janibacter cremeus]|uniref:Uncharacterized protein n=1 Tax=Janibacter cremeus TaxID=1285192 RepID=A0A852VTJ6_9MICO|nr:hypothetical protein [Janibacter cremeus]